MNDLLKPGCLLLLLLVPFWSVFAQPFNQDPGNPNLDFSSGNFSNWQLSWGTLTNPELHVGPEGPSSHVITERTGNNWDANAGIGNLARVPSGLERVARIGHPSGHGYGDPASYKMKYSIQVSNDYPILFFQIASLMDINHQNAQNTHYKFALKTAAGSYIPVQPCTGLELFPANSGNTMSNSIPPISYQLNANPTNTYQYQQWESVAADLSDYAGQTLTLELQHSDCYRGYHGSYTYFSAAMRKQYDTVYFCRGTAAVNLKPYLPNFSAYLWNTTASADSITISNPADGAVYTCTVGSYNECRTTFTYILKEIRTDAAFSAAGGSFCNQLQFSDQSISNAGEIIKWEWNFGDPASGASNYDTLQHAVHTFTGPGTYTVSLTVTDSFGCTGTGSKIINVSPEGTIAKIGLPYPSCIRDTVTIQDLTSNTTRRTWLIDGVPLADTAKALRYLFEQPGIYAITLIAVGSNGCADTAIQSLKVSDLPRSAIEVLPFSHAAPLSRPEFTFKGFEEDAVRYVWDFGYDNRIGEGQLVSFTYPTAIASYTVSLKTYDKNGCHNVASETVKVMPPDLRIPNAFSPNGDGSNDVFRILNITDHIIKEFSIYNRYGQRVFYSHKGENGWDGNFNGIPCAVGIYSYLIRYRLPDSDKDYLIKGAITLLR